MFSDNFKVEIFKNKAAAANSLADRCKVAKNVDKSLWFDAWDRFTVDAYSQIPEYPTFPISYKNSKQKRKEYNLEYKIECIKRFLPNLQKKHHFLSGAAKKSNQNLIDLLESWKCDLPPGTVIKLPTVDMNIALQRPAKPDPIELPLPPKFRKFAKRQKVNNRKLSPPPQKPGPGPTVLEQDSSRQPREFRNNLFDEELSLPSEFVPTS